MLNRGKSRIKLNVSFVGFNRNIILSWKWFDICSIVSFFFFRHIKIKINISVKQRKICIVTRPALCCDTALMLSEAGLKPFYFESRGHLENSTSSRLAK